MASDRVGQEFIMWYLKSAFDTYQNVQKTLQTRLTEMHSAALSPLQMMKNFIQGSSQEKASEAVKAINPDVSAGELTRLIKLFHASVREKRGSGHGEP